MSAGLPAGGKSARPALNVPLESLPPEGLKLSLNVGARALAALTTEPGQEPPTFTTALTGVLRIRRLGAGLEIRGDFRVGVTLACDRCLALTPVVLEGEIKETPPLTDLAEGDGGEDGGLVAVDGQVDLASFLAESFWLAWPYRFICRPDCAGLCLTCGADLNQGACGCLSPEDRAKIKTGY